MSISSSTGFKKIRKKLEDSSSHNFQRSCYRLLEYILPEVVYAQDLRIMDKKGIDLFIFGKNGTETENIFSLVVQCKGLEKQVVSTEHLKNFRSSIDKFRDSGSKCKEYWLVINRPIKDSDSRASLKEALDGLISNQVSEVVHLLDHGQFLKLIFAKLFEKLKSEISQRNDRHLAQYLNFVSTNKIYVKNVPFSLADSKKNRIRHSDITSHLAKELELCADSRKVRFLISDFGFGKTLSLLELAKDIRDTERLVTFHPFVEMNSDSFDNASSLMRMLYSNLWPENDTENLVSFPPFVAFKYLLEQDRSTILLLDGLDEHRKAYTQSGLADILGSLQSFGGDLVVSMRTNFFDDLQGNLGLALKRLGRDRTELYLEDWHEPHMLEFLSSWPNSNGIIEFRENIEKGDFDSIYGDIPKRPLFLQMLSEDLHHDQKCAQNLAQLYSNYFERKLSRDVNTPFDRGKDGGRLLSMPGVDHFSFIGSMYEALQNVAYKATSVETRTGRLELVEEFPEQEFKNEALNIGLKCEVSELLQHSLLISTGRRKLYGGNQLNLRFAHHSFHEYFVASWLAKNSPHVFKESPEMFPQTILRFGSELIELQGENKSTNS